MSVGSVDERIRAVLDLGDSSAAVKGLDAEVEKLLGDFKKQTELFEQNKMSPQQYADALHKVKSEVSGLSSAMKELGGGGGGVDLEGVTRKVFALEKGLTSMVEGTGLGRAGGLVESGMSLFGGPSGLGMLAASILYSIDKIGPQIKTAWDNLFKQFSQEDVTAKIAELKGYQTQLASQVKAILEKPVPGTEDLVATQQKQTEPAIQRRDHDWTEGHLARTGSGIEKRARSHGQRTATRGEARAGKILGEAAPQRAGQEDVGAGRRAGRRYAGLGGALERYGD